MSDLVLNKMKYIFEDRGCSQIRSKCIFIHPLGYQIDSSPGKSPEKSSAAGQKLPSENCRQAELHGVFFEKYLEGGPSRGAFWCICGVPLSSSPSSPTRPISGSLPGGDAFWFAFVTRDLLLSQISSPSGLPGIPSGLHPRGASLAAR